MTADTQEIPAVAIDFEATEATEQAEAMEIGHCNVAFSKEGILNPLEHPQAILCRPDRPITFGAMAVTGICPEDVEGRQSHKIVVPSRMPAGPAFIIGHNVDYDIQVAKNAGVDTSQYKAICTLAIARKLYPSYDHKLGALSYALNYKEARRYANSAHSAAIDVRLCVQLLRIFCAQAGITNMQALYEYSEMARIPEVMPMGQYKGMSIAEVGNDVEGRAYFFWLICTITDNIYLVKAAHKELIGKQVVCTKGNDLFKKGQHYTLREFTGMSTARFDGSTVEFTLSLDKKAIVVSSADSQVNALFKAA